MLLDKGSITGNNTYTLANANEVIDAVNANQTGPLQLPTSIYAVVGDTLQLFYKSMVIMDPSEKYHFRCQCTVGKQFPKYFEVTPSVVGTYTLTIALIDQDHVLVATKTTQLIVTAAVQQPSTQKNAWCIGASTTAAGIWSAELSRRLIGTGGTPVGHAFGNILVHTEGNPGHTWTEYLQAASSPFVFSGIDGDLDFPQYATNEGLNPPTQMNLFMTWNGMTTWRTDAQWDLWDDDVYEFIDGARAAYPTIEIVLMSQLYPSLIGGLGDDYGAKGAYYSDSMFNMRNQKRMAEIYDRISNEASYTSWVTHIECSLQHDAVNNVANFQKPVNTRNANTELFGNNGLHPSTEGYYQVADAAYREFIAKNCQ